MSEDLLYRENILDHYSHPHNAGRLSNPSAEHREYNPTCGDEITIFLNIDQNKITDVRFAGRGCAISQASASMLTDQLKNLSISQVRDITKEHIFENLGVEISPGRVKCALLILACANKALDTYTGETHDNT